MEQPLPQQPPDDRQWPTRGEPAPEIFPTFGHVENARDPSRAATGAHHPSVAANRSSVRFAPVVRHSAGLYATVRRVFCQLLQTVHLARSWLRSQSCGLLVRQVCYGRCDAACCSGRSFCAAASFALFGEVASMDRRRLLLHFAGHICSLDALGVSRSRFRWWCRYRSARSV